MRAEEVLDEVAKKVCQLDTSAHIQVTVIMLQVDNILMSVEEVDVQVYEVQHQTSC